MARQFRMFLVRVTADVNIEQILSYNRMASSPKIKRKKKVDACPNPLFVQWLTEWKDEAAEKGLKTQYAYGKVS